MNLGDVNLRPLGGGEGVTPEPPPAETIQAKQINLETKVNDFFETNPAGKKTEGEPGRFDFRGKWDRFKERQLNKEVFSQQQTNQIKHDLMQTFGGGMTHTLESAWAPPVAGLVFLGTLATVAVKGICGLVSKCVAKLTVLATVSKEDRAEIAKLQKEIKTESKEVEKAKNEAQAAFYKANNKLQKENTRIDKEISNCFKQIIQHLKSKYHAPPDIWDNLYFSENPNKKIKTTINPHHTFFDDKHAYSYRFNLPNIKKLTSS